jgi:hypothetical protein
MVGVTGSIPVAPTIRPVENSALSNWVATLSGAPRGLNKPRTVPKCRGDVGNRRALSSRMVLPCERDPRFASVAASGKNGVRPAIQGRGSGYRRQSWRVAIRMSERRT